ncbi:Odorant receptor 12, partial [Frankliniella occidentalis]
PLWLFLRLCIGLAVCKVLQESDSYRAAEKPLLALTSCYSANVALTVIRQMRYWNILREIKCLAEVLEDDLAEEVWVARTRRNIILFSSINLTFGISLGVSITLRFIISGDNTLLLLWPFVPYTGSWGLTIAQLVTGVCCPLLSITISIVVTALGCTTSTVTGLHHALAQCLIATATPEAVRNGAKLHQRLRRVTLDLTEFFAGNLAHVMASSFSHSSLAIVQVIASQEMTSTTFFQLFRVLVVFLWLSFLSQELSDSSLRLQRSAYLAATGSGTALAEARALNLVMLAASRPPALTCKGLGTLSLSSAGHVLRQLYSVINVLKKQN